MGELRTSWAEISRPGFKLNIGPAKLTLDYPKNYLLIENSHLMRVKKLFQLGHSVGPMGLGISSPDAHDLFVELTISVKNVEAMDVGGTSDPFVKITKRHIAKEEYKVYKNLPEARQHMDLPWDKIPILKASNYAPVATTNTVTQVLSCTFNTITLSFQELCYGDCLSHLEVKCYDFDVLGSNDLIGGTAIRVTDLISDESVVRTISRHENGVEKPAGKMKFNLKWFTSEEHYNLFKRKLGILKKVELEKVVEQHSSSGSDSM